MATSVNKVILIGNLGRDPELRYTQSGTPVTNFPVATTESWNKKDGDREEKTEWHRIVAWGRTAELCVQYLSKGRKVYIEGRLQTNEWENREGIKQRTTEIVANVVHFLDRPRGDGARRGDGGDSSRSNERRDNEDSFVANPRRGASGDDDAGDDIPF